MIDYAAARDVARKKVIEYATPPRAVAIVSGGMDSVTLAYHLKTLGYQLHMIAFDYGQRHRRELQAAQAIAERLNADYTLVDLTSVGALLGGSALTSPEIPVPDGHYAQENMRITVVPNRNAIMLTVAYGAAVAEGAKIVATAIHAGDHAIYPDCRPEFARLFDRMQAEAVAGFGDPDLHLYTPFIYRSKTDIVLEGAALGVPFADTWSCYKGGAVHCGTCGTCVERREAFQEAGITDPTVYAEG